MLTLTDPTDQKVRRWNGWSGAEHRRHQAALVAGGHVVEAKRQRAGRSAFIGGAWVDAGPGDVPVEQWKLALHGLELGQRGKVVRPLGRIVLPRPHHELYEAAWERIVHGDRPGGDQ